MFYVGMQVSMKMLNNKVSFGSDIIYKGRYIPHKQDQTHDVVRTHLEEKLGDYFFYLEQIAKEKKIIRPSVEHDLYFKKPQTKDVKDSNGVDFGLLKAMNIFALQERRPNELYSGTQLTCKPHEVAAFKKAGIKSIFGLVPYFEKDAVKKAGFVYSDLASVGETKLSVFDIKGDLIKDLIKHPELYADGQSDEKTESLKMFVKTLNGDNPDVPFPIYFGCHNGTDRTILWYELYKILKDEDMTKPLSPKTVEKLAMFAVDVEDYFRW